MIRRLRKRWVWFAVALAVAGAAVAAVVLTGNGPPPPRPVQVHDPDDSTDVIATASDAGFKFEVTLVNCGMRRLITSEERIDAEDVFCMARLDITNQGTEALLLDLSCQYLVDQDGNLHVMDPRVTHAATDQVARSLLLEGIPPGETLRDGRFMFDVPEDTVEAAVELRGTCDSPGIAVIL